MIVCPHSYSSFRFFLICLIIITPKDSGHINRWQKPTLCCIFAPITRNPPLFLCWRVYFVEDSKIEVLDFRPERNKISKICVMTSIYFDVLNQNSPFPRGKIALRKCNRVHNSLQPKWQHILTRWEGSRFTELTLIISVLNSNEKNLCDDFYLLGQ